MGRIMLPNIKWFDFGLFLLILMLGISGCQVETSDSHISVDIAAGEKHVQDYKIILSRRAGEISSSINELLGINNNQMPERSKAPVENGTYVTFQVQVPDDTPDDDAIYLSILDEVTGLALNADYFPMEDVSLKDGNSSGELKKILKVNLSYEVGSIIKYRYERQAGSAQVAEHFTDGTPVRYRLVHVTGSGKVEDTVSRWSDTEYNELTGRIIGKALDANTAKPIPNLLISVGGAQTISNSNGSFVIEGLTPGTHNLVAYALDGSYKPFQQGAKIAPDSSTPAMLELSQTDYVDVTFVVNVPPETPPAVPLRLAGNLYQLGNTFADFSGGVNTIAAKMPTLEPDENGIYKLTLSLPVGTDLRYKYSIGDGFWNAERGNPDGDFIVRQLIIPESDVQINDTVETWYSGLESALIFDATIPNTTPEDDYISIQFRPLFGWTEPIPMWKLEENRWAYVLYNPINLPGDFSYRYCRSGQCGKADDAATPGLYHEGRRIQLNNQPQTFDDQIISWFDYSPSIVPASETSTTVTARIDGFWAGVELADEHHPSWLDRLPVTFNKINEMGAIWVILSPSWTYGYKNPGNNPPVFEPSPGQDALWFDILDATAIGSEIGLGIAHYPKPKFQTESDGWWQSAERDYSWWLVWFNQYNEFLLHHADLAQKADADAMIIGGGWILPALPEAKLTDGTFSGVPADAENRWREIISEIRKRYEGELLWAHPGSNLSTLPPFIDEFDQIYLEIGIPDIKEPLSETDLREMEVELKNWLEVNAKSIYEETGKNIVISLSVSSSPDMQTQSSIYESVFNAINDREWINGFISSGFYPPAALQDASPSIHGKPAFDFLAHLFPKMLTED
jgi:hypothetical protein